MKLQSSLSSNFIARLDTVLEELEKLSTEVDIRRDKGLIPTERCLSKALLCVKNAKSYATNNKF